MGPTEWSVTVLGMVAVNKSQFNINTAEYVLLKEDVDFFMMFFMVTFILHKCWEMTFHDILCTLSVVWVI